NLRRTIVEGAAERRHPHVRFLEASRCTLRAMDDPRPNRFFRSDPIRGVRARRTGSTLRAFRKAGIANPWSRDHCSELGNVIQRRWDSSITALASILPRLGGRRFALQGRTHMLGSGSVPHWFRRAISLLNTETPQWQASSASRRERPKRPVAAPK